MSAQEPATVAEAWEGLAAAWDALLAELAAPVDRLLEWLTKKS